MRLEDVKFDAEGLVPVVVRDAATGGVAMVAWANREALLRTLESRRATFWSRSRRALWVKGETSGNHMEVLSVSADCDGDAVLYEAHLSGPACHTGQTSCFHNPLGGASPENVVGTGPADLHPPQPNVGTGPAGLHPPQSTPENFDLGPLFAVLESRRREKPEGSYSTKLFERGLDHILKKFGEEASEVIVAMKNPDDDAVAGEIADVLYHLAAAMTERGISPIAVNRALAKRRRAKP
jgi:phosphoribosyl-ATP pyrophosphohydrolase/phosphoribosyl-AMP cyclohydrolase